VHRLIRPSRRDESGAIIVFAAILLVVMLGVSALVFDQGIARVQRGRMQNAADSAVLGAAQDLPDTAATNTQARLIGSKNLPQFTVNWDACNNTNDPLPPGYVRIAGCVSRNGAFTRVRVRVPRQTFPAIFGGIFDNSGLSTSTVAIAGLRSAGLSAVLPFSLFSGTPNGETCVKFAPTGPNCPRPNGEEQGGNFNVLDVAQFGNPTLGTDTGGSRPYCDNNENFRLEENIAMGVDHPLAIYTGTQVLDDCGVPAAPNTLRQSTGNKTDPIDSGLLHGGTYPDGGLPRLRRGCGNCTTVAGVSADNNGLWQYVNPAIEGSTSVPAACWPSVFNAVLALPNGTQPEQDAQRDAMHLALEACILAYEAGGYTAPVFNLNSGPDSPLDLLDIQKTPRLGYLPRFIEAGPCGNQPCLHIAEFRAVYVQTLVGGCNSGGGGGCSTHFEPGPWNQGAVGQSNDRIQALSAWLLPRGMLPSPIDSDPFAVGFNTVIELVG
jgi:hypothetical protein